MPASGRGRAKISGQTHLFGPVPSRRLGLSLGIDLTPRKVCTYDCLYCEVCPTTRKSVRRGSWVRPREVLGEVRGWLRAGNRCDVITISGSGEPTLNRGLGAVIRGLKRMTDIPVAVITNGSLLYRPDVQRDLAQADWLLPTVIDPDPAVFARLHRPHGALRHARVLEGLLGLRRWFKGRVRLEVMLVRGINDGPAALRALAGLAGAMRPDHVDVNTVVRPPAYPQARAVTKATLEKFARLAGAAAKSIAGPSGRAAFRAPRDRGWEQALVRALERRPMTADDAARAFGVSPARARALLAALAREGRLQRGRQGGKSYYHAPRRA